MNVAFSLIGLSGPTVWEKTLFIPVLCALL